MAGTMRRAIWTLATMCVLLVGERVASAVEDTAAVHVRYVKGKAEIGVLKEGVKLYTNRDYPLEKIPDEISGLNFTCVPIGKKSSVEINVPKGQTVYLIVDSEKSRSDAVDLNRQLPASGWIRLVDTAFTVKSKSQYLAIYKQRVSQDHRFELDAPSFAGYIVAAREVVLERDGDPAAEKPGDPNTDKPGDPTQTATARIEDDKPALGPTTRPAMVQTSIHCLEVYDLDSGLKLGRTHEVTLTLTPGKKSKRVRLMFATPIGKEMVLAGNDALRYVWVTYPNWYVDQAVLTFEDKYTPHDGGSIATAIATMTMSVIQGIHIDPKIAITGDIGANGHVQPIGGVAAKIRGAIAGKCNLVAIPSENEGELTDAVVYSGPELLSQIQVIGISTLEDAIATVRIDRETQLSEALDLFAQVAVGINADPKYLKTPEAKQKLTQVLILAPQHLSAKLLLAIIDGKQPKTLSASASQYYTSLAAHNMMAVLNERFDSHQKQTVPSGVVRAGLADLHKLLPMADANVKPLITAWMRFVESYNDLTQGDGTAKNYEAQRQSLLDEMTREDTNPDLMQKKLKEGM